MSESTNRSAEKTLVFISKLMLVLGGIFALFMLFSQINLAIELVEYGEGGFGTFVVAVFYSVVVFIPFLVSWAVLRVFANISLNIIDLRNDVEEMNLRNTPKPQVEDSSKWAPKNNRWGE